MALAMLMVQKQELLTKIENENISRKQNDQQNFAMLLSFTNVYEF